MKTIITLWDVRKEKLLQNAIEEQAAMKEVRDRDDLNAVLDANPDIGVLMRAGRQIYYKNAPYREAGDPRDLF